MVVESTRFYCFSIIFSGIIIFYFYVCEQSFIGILDYFEDYFFLANFGYLSLVHAFWEVIERLQNYFISLSTVYFGKHST